MKIKNILMPHGVDSSNGPYLKKLRLVLNWMHAIGVVSAFIFLNILILDRAISKKDALMFNEYWTFTNAFFGGMFIYFALYFFIRDKYKKLQKEKFSFNKNE